MRVWTIALEEAERDQVADLQLLDAEERARANRFRFALHRARFTARRASYRRLLGDALGVPPATLRFTVGAHGKPALARGDAEFSSSHSGAWAMLALAPRAVGVDLEATHPRLDDPALHARVLAPGEAAAFATLPAPERAAAFVRAWTLKEAVAKALGEGLSREVAGLDLWRPEPRATWTDPPSSRVFTLAHLPAPPGQCASLAVEGTGPVRVLPG